MAPFRRKGAIDGLSTLEVVKDGQADLKLGGIGAAIRLMMVVYPTFVVGVKFELVSTKPRLPRM